MTKLCKSCGVPFAIHLGVQGTCAKLQETLAINAELLAACKKALSFVSDEDNNPVIVKMSGSFGLWTDLESAVARAERS